MTDEHEPALYEEVGARWRVLLFGPCFALFGVGVELLAGQVYVMLWVVVAAVLTGFTALWVYAVRRFGTVRLTAHTLTIGEEPLAVERIAEVLEGPPPKRAKVLGGWTTVPKKREELPLRLDDDNVVLAWARDADALRSALRGVIRA